MHSVTFTTEEGSTYCIDYDTKSVTQLAGEVRSKRVAAGRVYRHVTPIEVGEPVLVIWDKDTPLLGKVDGPTFPATIISPVKTILDRC